MPITYQMWFNKQEEEKLLVSYEFDIDEIMKEALEDKEKLKQIDSFKKWCKAKYEMEEVD